MIRTSESIDKLAFALVAAQAVMPGVPRATKGQVGNQVRYYTDLATVVEAVRPVLAAHGLAYVQFPCNTLAGHIGICTRLLHQSGEWMEDEYSMPAGQGAQGAGSALTYGKRYALMSVLGIAADDDDGAAASQGQAKPRRAATAPPAVAPRVDESSGDTAGTVLYRRLRDPMSEATKAHLRELASHHNCRLTAAGLDADANWFEIVRGVLDGAPR